MNTAFPTKFNPHARFVWQEVLDDPDVTVKGREAAYRKRCATYGLVPLAGPTRDNGVIQRYLVRNRIEIIKEMTAFYALVGHTRIKDIKHTYTVHKDNTFVLRGEILLYPIPITIAALKTAMMKPHLNGAFYRKTGPTEIQKILLRNRLVRTAVSGMNAARVTFAYEIRVLQPLFLPPEVELTKEGISSFIEKKLWYPIALAHRVRSIKLRTFL